MWLPVVAAVVVIGGFLAAQFSVENRRAYDRLGQYLVHTISTEFGKMSYVDEGTGPAVLISHGIMGGYDQGIVSLDSALGGGHREIAPSRFGYPGSDLPPDPTPENQAKAFLALLDHLGVQKAFILTTSAGGAAGIQFALHYPDRVSGLILLSSGVPSAKKSSAQIGMMGPPPPLLHDFPLWLCCRYLRFAFQSMMGSDISRDFLHTMLPAAPRRAGVIADSNVTNPDMLLHHDNYPVERITAPVLVVQAEDDPLAKFSDTRELITRVHPQTAIFRTGGHLVTGHGDAVSRAIRSFVEQTIAE